MRETQAQKIARLEAEVDRLQSQVSYLQGHTIALRTQLDETRADAHQRLRYAKKQRAVLDAVVSAARTAGLSLGADVTRLIVETQYGNNDDTVTVALRRFAPERAEPFIGQGYVR